MQQKGEAATAATVFAQQDTMESGGKSGGKHPPTSRKGVDAEKCIGNTTDCNSTHKRNARCLTRGPNRPRWPKEEDAEIRNHICLHGVGKWKDALDKSSLLQDRFAAASGMF